MAECDLFRGVRAAALADRHGGRSLRFQAKPSIASLDRAAISLMTACHASVIQPSRRRHVQVIAAAYVELARPASGGSTAAFRTMPEREQGSADRHTGEHDHGWTALLCLEVPGAA